MRDVVASIQVSAGDRLAGFTSMYDLAVTSVPVPSEGPVDVVWVRPQIYGSADNPDVLIEHHAVTGHDDRIVRPGTDAVRLFWRFVIEKYGIEPATPAA